MFNWLSRLFSSAPQVPPTMEGAYRAPKKTAPAIVAAPRETLFERPADLPTPQPVNVVTPTTEADHYRWLDDDALPLSASTTPPPPVAVPSYASGNYNVSGMCMAISGCVTNWCVTTGRWLRQDR